ncbi:hypothetical protein Dsin_032916 [Dipteronia sinensis]|uniref:Uncharacterized protein n=1 Tax=Dipteronia sinensis TaxID=43782 RepID=A0AAE0DQ96_9ROSI|nr:hypothetical protein Dsin_032916 [Dipteronia sinensis]
MERMKKPSNNCRLLVTCWNNKILAQSLTYSALMMASLRGFQRFMRHVIAVYGTHLNGRFGGTMFVATAQY